MADVDALTLTVAVGLGLVSGCSLLTSFDQLTEGEPAGLTPSSDAGGDADHALDANVQDPEEGGGDATPPSGVFLRGIEKHRLASAASLVVRVPGVAEPGDLLILTAISTYSGANGGGLPGSIPGWKTHMSGGSFPQGCDQGHRLLIASRVAQVDDPTSVAIDVGHSWPLGAIMLAYGGVNVSSPIDNDATATLTTAPLVAPSVLATSSHALVLRMLAFRPSAGPYTTAPSLVERTSIGALTVFEGTQSAPGPTGEAAFEPANSVCYANTATLVLRPK